MRAQWGCFANTRFIRRFRGIRPDTGRTAGHDGADLKLLRFDWELVAGTSFYRLMIKPGASSVYQPLGSCDTSHS